MIRKVLMVDDHEVVRLGIQMLLIKEINRSVIFFGTDNMTDAVKIARENSDLDLAILDMNIPNYSCERMIELLRIHSASAKIIVLTVSNEMYLLKRLYKLGAHAVLNKGIHYEEMKEALHHVMTRDGKYFSRDFLQKFAESGIVEGIGDNPFESLSGREWDVLVLLIKGLTREEIGVRLNLKSTTIGTYKARIFDKLGVSNVIDLYNMYESYRGTKSNE